MARAKAKSRSTSRAAGTSGTAGTSGSAKPALQPGAGSPGKYQNSAVGNSIPAGSTSGPPIVAPAAPNITQIPIQTLSAGSGTAGVQLGGGAKPAAVPADQSKYSVSPDSDSAADVNSKPSGGYGQY